MLLKAGFAAGAVALFGMLLLLPLFIVHRREVRRLLDWQEREPDRGDPGPAPGGPITGSYPIPSGGLTPAERVTLDRPALSRITAERAALQSPSFWRRLAARGPRHPLVISGLVLALAIVAVAVVAIAGRTDAGRERTTNLDRSTVSVVVLNGSSQPSLVNKLADTVDAAGFTEVRTGSTAPTAKSTVLYAKRRKQEANAVARELNIDVIKKLGRTQEAMAPGAQVVILAGEDRASGK